MYANTLRGFPLVLLGLLAASVRADYEPLRLGELIGLADVIVIGKIAAVEKLTFDIEVQESWIGERSPGESLTVKRFRDWGCAQRWEKYAVGQRVLLFLQRDQESQQPWQILGAGDEGESRVTDDGVIPNFLIDEEAGRRAVTLAQLQPAVVDFRAAYRMTRGEHPTIDPKGSRGRLWFERIVFVPGSKAYSPPSNFRPRFPPGETPPSRTPPFAARSPLHRELAKWADDERERIVQSRK